MTVRCDEVCSKRDGLDFRTVALPQVTGDKAAYGDHSARYLNHSGAAVIWDHPDGRFDADINALLGAAQSLALRIGPWEGQRPILSPGRARLSLLTPSGLHFGEAPFDALARDPMSAPVVTAATKLVAELTKIAANP
jgi:hypothetical protein